MFRPTVVCFDVSGTCVRTRRPSRPGDMILSPGWARIPANSVCTADFTEEVKHQKRHTLGLQTSTTLGARTKQPFIATTTNLSQNYGSGRRIADNSSATSNNLRQPHKTPVKSLTDDTCT
ncbi:unnamed protein product [Sphacelaria rigidula]